MKYLSDLHAGRAGEHLAAADIISQGYDCFSAAQGMPYDLIADIGGRLLRVQVKTTRKPSKMPNREREMFGYGFNVRRCGNGGRESYKAGDVDLFALVALDSKEVGYLSINEMPGTLFIRPETFRGTYADEIIVERNRAIYDRLMKGEKPADLGREYGLDRAYVCRLKFGRARTFVSGFYMNDLSLGRALVGLDGETRSLRSSKKSFIPANDNTPS